jgi:hypothetical protein
LKIIRKAIYYTIMMIQSDKLLKVHKTNLCLSKWKTMQEC